MDADEDGWVALKVDGCLPGIQEINYVGLDMVMKILNLLYLF